MAPFASLVEIRGGNVSVIKFKRLEKTYPVLKKAPPHEDVWGMQVMFKALTSVLVSFMPRLLYPW
jgi:hypothetical protein